MGTREVSGKVGKGLLEEGLEREVSKQSKAVFVSLRWFLGVEFCESKENRGKLKTMRSITIQGKWPRKVLIISHDQAVGKFSLKYKEQVQSIIETHQTTGSTPPPGQNITSIGKWKWILVSFTLKIKILLMQVMLFYEDGGQLVTKVKIKAPLPFTGMDFGLTSTQLLPCSSRPTSSASKVNAKFSVLLNANFTSFLLLFLTIPILIILVPSQLTNSRLHLTSGNLAT